MKIGSFIFLELSCRSCLYILEISCLSVASFAIIFSHSEGCLFTLLIVSFDVQKLLRLIRSHLFIFAFISNILGGKESACQCRRYRRHRFNPWVRNCPGEGNGNALQYSCLENPMDRGTWRATVHQLQSWT